MVYQVTYELRNSDKDYSALFSYLENSQDGIKGKGIHVLRDVWWISIEDGSVMTTFSEQLKKYMGDNDLFYYSKLNIGEINGWMPHSCWGWLRTNSNDRL